MKTWDDWSDREIDSSVATIVFDCIGWSKSKSKNVLYIECTVTKEIKVQTVPNYCNNPVDMWPIILENNIVITPRMGSNIGDATGYSEHQNPVISEFNDNSKALRSAAIVFLMMNGVNPE